ncbi:fasciclin domain-containing protein [Pontibacter cellulosilyticus]|uniref:Fasciclin domain-containing protein n=1 Tax=Pontibacter cellulosilyticus TaxID=1720253 RepID=A0A923SJ62_9BACT|nr:fasciclin domain-containing protein [Pontibacter cellulosilyticus]MBC5993564.1 fasciclin domain-containing protein [Pontibacter cellulosilyticus]
MKKRTYILLILGFGAFNIVGCASSDSTTDTAMGTETETAIRTEDAPPKEAMEADTEMEAEEKADVNVSANNPIGSESSIVALIQQNPNLSTFLELIRAANMVVVLESPAPYTVFAPTNQAFAALPAGTVEALKKTDDKIELRRLLQSHILPNKITTAEMRDNMPMKTAQGEEVIARRKGQILTVGDATVVTADVNASNGVVHVIDRVLAPPQK